MLLQRRGTRIVELVCVQDAFDRPAVLLTQTVQARLPTVPAGHPHYKHYTACTSNCAPFSDVRLLARSYALSPCPPGRNPCRAYVSAGTCLKRPFRVYVYMQTSTQHMSAGLNTKGGGHTSQWPAGNSGIIQQQGHPWPPPALHMRESMPGGIPAASIKHAKTVAWKTQQAPKAAP